MEKNLPLEGERFDPNVRLMVEAARKLELYTSPECAACDGLAYLLVKQETVRAAVAVIFGYVDNHTACEEIAEVLSNAPSTGTFKCAPIY